MGIRVYGRSTVYGNPIRDKSVLKFFYCQTYINGELKFLTPPGEHTPRRFNSKKDATKYLKSIGMFGIKGIKIVAIKSQVIR